MSTATTTAPSTHTAGDSVDWLLSAEGYLATAGWTAQLVLIGPARLVVNCAGAGDAFAAQADSAATAAWAPGAYSVRLLLSKAGSRVTLDLPALTVRPNPADVATSAASLLTAAEKHLADLQAAYRAHMASGSAVLAEVRVGDRMRKFKGVEDLLKAITHAEQQVERERATAAIAAGASARQRFVVRM